MVDLDIVLSNQVSEVVDIGGKRITSDPAVLVFWRRFIPALHWVVKRRAIGWKI
jgi:hypothetical protein